MILFESDSTRAAFYFAAEEYIMRELRPREAALMLWSTGDTVMLGANQVADAEADRTYAKASGIEIVRRSSGGGAIFTDGGTLQYTVILPYKTGMSARDFVRDWLAEPVVRTTARFGAAATFEGRNDIVISGRKISGTAQYIKNGYICSHGSLLFNTDMEKLAKALTVDPGKIQTKAVASIRARVTNISEHISEKDMSRFREALIESFGLKDAVSRRNFSTDELEKIETLRSARYDNPAWTFGREPAFTYTNRKRFQGGQIEVYLDVKGSIIQTANIRGDFLAMRELCGLEQALAGTAFEKEAVRTALRPIDVRSFLGSLGEDELLETMF